MKGGNLHPLNVGRFILLHLDRVGADYISHIHQAYKKELDRLAREKDRRQPYHKARYRSFKIVAWKLAQEGLIEFTGKEEVSDSSKSSNLELPPVRRYYRLTDSGNQAIEAKNC